MPTGGASAGKRGGGGKEIYTHPSGLEIGWGGGGGGGPGKT